MNKYTFSGYSDFIDRFLINDTAEMLKAGFELQALLVMTHAMEVLGAIMDGKPLKADQQSQKRFARALSLFPPSYQQVNRNNWLYVQLRCNLAHTLIPGRFIKLDNSTNAPLEQKEQLLLINVHLFFNDFRNACESVAGMIKAKDVRNDPFG